jgi:hypothetical protein
MDRKCECCQKEFISTHHLKIHKNARIKCVNTENEFMECDVCQKRIRTKNYRNHKKYHEYVKKKFPDRFESQLKKQKTTRSERCEICDALYKRRRNLVSLKD